MEYLRRRKNEGFGYACCYVDSMQGKQDLHVAKNFTPGVTGVK
jgi:hypothetical protein